MQANPVILHRAVCYAEICIDVNLLIFTIYKAIGKGQLVMSAITAKARPIHLITPLWSNGFGVKGNSCKVRGQSSAHEPLSEDLSIRGSKRLNGISAREAVRFARLLHRNSIFQCFKGGKEEEKSNWKTLAVG